jgi:hypothetical protein
VAEEGLLGTGGARSGRVLRQAGRHGRSLLLGTRPAAAVARPVGAAGTGGYGRPPDAYGSPLRVTERWAVATGIHASTRVAALRGPATGRFSRGAGGNRPAHKRDLQGKRPPKVAVVLQALNHHTAGHRRIWKSLRHGSQVSGEPHAPFPRSLPGSHPTGRGSYTYPRRVRTGCDDGKNQGFRSHPGSGRRRSTITS